MSRSSRDGSSSASCGQSGRRRRDAPPPPPPPRPSHLLSQVESLLGEFGGYDDAPRGLGEVSYSSSSPLTLSQERPGESPDPMLTKTMNRPLNLQSGISTSCSPVVEHDVGDDIAAADDYVVKDRSVKKKAKPRRRKPMHRRGWFLSNPDATPQDFLSELGDVLDDDDDIDDGAEVDYSRPDADHPAWPDGSPSDVSSWCLATDAPEEEESKVQPYQQQPVKNATIFIMKKKKNMNSTTTKKKKKVKAKKKKKPKVKKVKKVRKKKVKKVKRTKKSKKKKNTKKKSKKQEQQQEEEEAHHPKDEDTNKEEPSSDDDDDDDDDDGITTTTPGIILPPALRNLHLPGAVAVLPITGFMIRKKSGEAVVVVEEVKTIKKEEKTDPVPALPLGVPVQPRPVVHLVRPRSHRENKMKHLSRPTVALPKLPSLTIHEDTEIPMVRMTSSVERKSNDDVVSGAIRNNLPPPPPVLPSRDRRPSLVELQQRSEIEEEARIHHHRIQRRPPPPPRPSLAASSFIFQKKKVISRPTRAPPALPTAPKPPSRIGRPGVQQMIPPPPSRIGRPGVQQMMMKKNTKKSKKSKNKMALDENVSRRCSGRHERLSFLDRPKRVKGRRKRRSLDTKIRLGGLLAIVTAIEDGREDQKKGRK